MGTTWNILARLRALDARVAALEARVAALEAQLQANSREEA